MLHINISNLIENGLLVIGIIYVDAILQAARCEYLEFHSIKIYLSLLIKLYLHIKNDDYWSISLFTVALVSVIWKHVELKT